MYMGYGVRRHFWLWGLWLVGSYYGIIVCIGDCGYVICEFGRHLRHREMWVIGSSYSGLQFV